MAANQFADMFVAPDEDPRTEPPRTGDEITTLIGFLQWQRETLELKCSGLEAADLARRSVEPSTLSLLGLVRSPGGRRTQLVPADVGRAGRSADLLLGV
jgi:hypothetical protein